MKGGKMKIGLIATLAICSALYVAVTMLFIQIYVVGGYMTKKPLFGNMTNVVIRDTALSLGIYSMGCCVLLLFNMIQCAFIFYQRFWTWCLTLCFKIVCIGHNIGFVVYMSLIYSGCDWKSLTYKWPGPDNIFYHASKVCVVYGCSPEPFTDCYWLQKSQLFTTIEFLLGFAALFEIFFLVLYRRHTFKNASMPNCCQLSPIDSVTNPNSIVAEQLSPTQSDSIESVNQPIQSITNVNFEEDTISEE